MITLIIDTIKWVFPNQVRFSVNTSLFSMELALYTQGKWQSVIMTLDQITWDVHGKNPWRCQDTFPSFASHHLKTISHTCHHFPLQTGRLSVSTKGRRRGGGHWEILVLDLLSHPCNQNNQLLQPSLAKHQGWVGVLTVYYSSKSLLGLV